MLTVESRRGNQYLVDLFVRPRTAMQELLRDPRRVAFGFVGPAILAAVYFAGISAKMALNAMHLPKFLVLNIPAEQYYAYERFFILPMGIAGVMLASGSIRLTAQAWKGQGRFEDLFALLGFSEIVIAVVMGLPDLVQGVLIGTGILPTVDWSSVAPWVWLGTVWYFGLTVLAVRKVERLSWAKTIGLALIGFVANGLVQFVVMR